MVTLAALSHLCSENSGALRSKDRIEPTFPKMYIGPDIGTRPTPPPEPYDRAQGRSWCGPINAGKLGVPGGTIGESSPADSRGVRARLPQAAVRRPSLVERWRESVVGLARLAHQNLSLAKNHLGMRNHASALEYAATSLENISRALIHCLGGKPDKEGGQEEALRILSSKMQGEKKTELEEAIDSMATVNRDLTTMRESLKSNRRPSVGQAEIRKIIGSVSKAVVLLRQIIVKHFASEIPGLNIACPRCQSLYLLSVWAVGGAGIHHECGLCHHKWFKRLHDLNARVHM